MPSPITATGKRFISDLASSLDIPPERYESAERSYKSVCDWLERPFSRFAHTRITAYTQGSFRLGTAIRPANGEEHYDLDVVYEFSIKKSVHTQKRLFDDLGHELKLYAAYHGMSLPTGWDRCWTLEYADSAQFHMDLLPSAPDGARQRQLRETKASALDFVDKSISITDKTHPNYTLHSEDWPSSNPNGFAEWFYLRMKEAFDKRRLTMAVRASKEVADIPIFRVKTALQASIQILKRHRDLRFSEEKELRPSSIIITTLAAHAYNQEAEIPEALLSILQNMDKYIQNRNGVDWIANPSDPRENFADAWQDAPDKKAAFFDWLETARADFAQAARSNNLDDIVEILAPRIGRELAKKAAGTSGSAGKGSLITASATLTKLMRLRDAPHRKPSSWPMNLWGIVALSCTRTRDGSSAINVRNDDPIPVPVGWSLDFSATTNIPPPFKVFWQVVNTGRKAAAAKKLRGNFEGVESSKSNLQWSEDALYPGSHTMQCFIVKHGECVAKSEPFVVNIA
ncbi:nucleotidyltransferase [Pseudomonas sp. DP-17]|uniref:nucleotidyltransferase n=1 Tax=Pseudomonas sp. DP-17 TaxID=1580486 RepID=UPI001EFB8647|nr:nucleotidyltransferase [Pseudomonas sp. DP-17]MCG8905605.1 nucleotidyltransferase [Pseudomonas sp. DP-17]